jgi:plastocyanin
VGDGDTTFADFIAEVAANKSAETWEFDAEDTTVTPGTTLRLRNVGGELHTFTHVADFGPGLVPPTAPTVAWTYKYPCAIHPCMRTVLQVHS